MTITTFGLDVLQIIKVIAALLTTYLIARILSMTLEKLFEKTPLPEQLESGIVRA